MPFERPIVHKEINKKMGDKMLGRGVEKSVWGHKESPEKVIGVYHKDRGIHPETMKAKKYFMDILHMLYPEHFTKVYSTGARDNKEGTQSYAFLKRLDLDERHKAIEAWRHVRGKEYWQQKEKFDKIGQEILDSEQFKNFEKLLEGLGIDINGQYGVFEKGYGNFTFDPDGTIRMIEMGDPFGYDGEINAGKTEIDLAFEEKKLRARIEEKLTGDEKTRALIYLDRIIKLKEELENRLKEERATMQAKWEKDRARKEKIRQNRKNK